MRGRTRYHMITITDRGTLAEQLVQLGACPEVYNGRSRCTYDERKECVRCLRVWLEEPENNRERGRD